MLLTTVSPGWGYFRDVHGSSSGDHSLVGVGWHLPGSCMIALLARESPQVSTLARTDSGEE